MKLASDNMNDYIKNTKYINYDNQQVKEKADDLAQDCKNQIEMIEKLYNYVRDEIAHSWDIQNRQVTITASDVLREGHGICYAKSNLLAALLRCQGIPTGICYQKLTLGDTPDTGYVIHALNAVYIEERNQWIRLDARGNKEGIQAKFSLDEEYLAFPVRPEYGELDYDIIYPDPHEVTMNALESNDDILYMCLHSLPSDL